MSKSSPTKCDVCGETLFGTYIKDAWGLQAHEGHGVSLCDCCGRIMSQKTTRGAYQYDDGRMICGLCKKDVLTKSWDINRSKRGVYDTLHKIGFTKIPAEVPLSLVSRNHLANTSGHFHTKGLTLTKTFYKNKIRSHMNHEIRILHGLPSVEFEGILAHEYLHVWLNEHHFKLNEMYTEGFCNLASFWIYQKSKSDLAGYLKKRLFESSDPVYGRGFKLMHQKLINAGWPRLIEDMLGNKEGFFDSLWKKIFG